MTPEPKHTIDTKGNWTTVYVIRTRVGNGWIETVVPAPEKRRAA